MHYLLTSSLILAGFYAVYWLLLRKLSFHTWNRYYLLLALALSLVIPVLPVLPPTETEIVLKAIVADETETSSFVPTTGLPSSFDWLLWGWRLYMVVAAVLLLRLVVRLGIVVRQILRMKAAYWEDLRVFPYVGGQSASFFGWVFLNDASLSNAERDQVLRHEQLHYHLYHSADRLLIECVKAVAWINPVVYWWGRSLTDLHEYEVDERMARDFETREYAHLLLKLATRAEPVLMNRFAREPLKNRIQFLLTKPSQTMKKALFLLVLPLTASAVVLFAQQAPSSSQKTQQPAPPSFPAGRIEMPPPPQPANFAGWKPYVVNYRDYSRFLNAAKTAKPKWESLVPGDWAASLARYANQSSIGVKSVSWEQAEAFVEWKNYSNRIQGAVYRMAEADERKNLPYGIWCVRAMYPVKGEARISAPSAVKEVRSTRVAPPVIERDPSSEMAKVIINPKKTFVEPTIVKDEPAPKVDLTEFKANPKTKALDTVKPDTIESVRKEQQKTPARP